MRKIGHKNPDFECVNTSIYSSYLNSAEESIFLIVPNVRKVKGTILIFQISNNHPKSISSTLLTSKQTTKVSQLLSYSVTPPRL